MYPYDLLKHMSMNHFNQHTSTKIYKWEPTHMLLAELVSVAGCQGSHEQTKNKEWLGTSLLTELNNPTLQWHLQKIETT